MYKGYLKKRGWDTKNIRAEDVVEIVRIKQQRDSNMKRSEFFLHGRRIDWEKIQRYLRRNPSVMSKVRAIDRETSSPQSTPRVICRTPADGSDDRQSTPSMPDSIDSADVVEKVVRAIVSYADGALECGRWIPDESGRLISGKGGRLAHERLDCWESGMIEALEMISNNNIHGFSVLSQVLDRTRTVLRDEDPELLSKMAKVALYIPKEKQDLFWAIRRHFCGVSAAVLRPGHPVTVFWTHFGGDDTPTTRYYVKVALEALIGELEKLTDVTQTSFTLRRRLIRFSTWGGFLTPRESEWELRQLISLGNDSPWLSWEDIFRAGIDLCTVLQSSRDLATAESVLRSLCNWNSKIRLVSRCGRLHYEYLWVLLRMCNLYDEPNIASQVSTQLLELCEERYGLFDCKTLCALERFQETLARSGREGEAESVRKDLEIRAGQVTVC